MSLLFPYAFTPATKEAIRFYAVVSHCCLNAGTARCWILSPSRCSQFLPLGTLLQIFYFKMSLHSLNSFVYNVFAGMGAMEGPETEKMDLWIYWWPDYFSRFGEIWPCPCLDHRASSLDTERSFSFQLTFLCGNMLLRVVGNQSLDQVLQLDGIPFLWRIILGRADTKQELRELNQEYLLSERRKVRSLIFIFAQYGYFIS